jgi:hypothetical protein
VLEEVKPAEDGRIRIQGEDQEFKRKEAQKRNEHEGGVLGEREASDPAHGKEGGGTKSILGGWRFWRKTLVLMMEESESRED